MLVKFPVKVGAWRHTCGGRGQRVFRRRVPLRRERVHGFNGGTRRIKSTTVSARTSGLPSSLNLVEKKKRRRRTGVIGGIRITAGALWTHQDHQDGGGALRWVLILLMKVLSSGIWQLYRLYALKYVCIIKMSNNERAEVTPEPQNKKPKRLFRA